MIGIPNIDGNNGKVEKILLYEDSVSSCINDHRINIQKNGKLYHIR